MMACISKEKPSKNPNMLNPAICFELKENPERRTAKKKRFAAKQIINHCFRQ